MIFGIHLGARECDWTFWTSPVSVGRSSWSLRIRGVWQSVSMLRNAPGPSGAPLPDMASPSWSLRTTKETGLNHFSAGWTKKMFRPSDWRVPFAPENPRLQQFSPSNLPGSLPTEKTGGNRKNEKTAGKTPKERHEKPAKKTRTNDNAKKPKPKTERDRDNLGQTGRCVESLDTVFPECDRSLRSVVVQALWLVCGSLAVCKAHWHSSLEDDVCVTCESPCAALGFEPSDSDFVFSLFSRLSFLALGSTHNSSCLCGSGSTAASLGGSPSSSLSSSSSCCWSLWVWHQQLPRQPAEASGAATPGFLGALPFVRRVFGADSFLLHRCHPHCFESSSFLWQLGRFLFGLPARLRHLVGFWVAALQLVPPLPGDRMPLTHSPRREVVSGPATRGVPTRRLLGVAKRWCCFGSHTLPSRTVALFAQSYPAVLEVTLPQRGCN